MFFCRKSLQLKDIENKFDLEFQRKAAIIIQIEKDLQKYLPASTGIGQLPKEKIDLQVMESRLNDARVRNHLDPYIKMSSDNKIHMKMSLTIYLNLMGRIL